MNVSITIVHALVALGLISLILLQSAQGGLGSAFGSGDLYRTKRGAERIIFVATGVAALLFLATSILVVLLR